MVGCATLGTPNYATDFAWLSKSADIDKPVDVFYVHPTIYGDESPLNMDIARQDLRDRAQGLLTAQAGVYSPYANLFAPYYRQQSAATLSMEPNKGEHDAYADEAFQIGYGDVERAFDYYLQHLNPDRPFLLAGHSQGSMVLIELMRRRLGDPALQERLVAAYVIGYSVTQDDLGKYPQMKLAQGETDTGVMITYNTQGPNAKGSPVLLPGAVAINPLNWKADGTVAHREQNIEAVFFDADADTPIEKCPHFCGAFIDTRTGALIATDLQPLDKVDVVHMGRWPEEVYHRFDYAFFYSNLKRNVEKRIDAYLARCEGE